MAGKRDDLKAELARARTELWQAWDDTREICDGPSRLGMLNGLSKTLVALIAAETQLDSDGRIDPEGASTDAAVSRVLKLVKTREAAAGAAGNGKKNGSH